MRRGGVCSIGGGWGLLYRKRLRLLYEKRWSLLYRKRLVFAL
jgi:hypothetical protein